MSGLKPVNAIYHLSYSDAENGDLRKSGVFAGQSVDGVETHEVREIGIRQRHRGAWEREIGPGNPGVYRIVSTNEINLHADCETMSHS